MGKTFNGTDAHLSAFIKWAQGNRIRETSWAPGYYVENVRAADDGPYTFECDGPRGGSTQRGLCLGKKGNWEIVDDDQGAPSPEQKEQESALFYLVWNSLSGYTKKPHETLADARAEAERLAGATPLAEFHVLRSVGYAKTGGVQWRES